MRGDIRAESINIYIFRRIWTYEFWNHVIILNSIIIRATPAGVRTSIRKGINIREDTGESNTLIFIRSAPGSPDSG